MLPFYVLNSRSISVPEEGPKSDCQFQFYGQLRRNDVSLPQLEELEEEIDHPTGITTIRQPRMLLKGVLMSKNCGVLYELPELTGMK